MRRLLAAAAAAALVAAGAIVQIAPAAADPVGSCTTSKGVLVVVDLRTFGGQITRGCDASPTNGRAALEKAGFRTVDVARQPGFVCRINGEPSGDPCVNTPPASAYWSYWHANAGQRSWSYSSLGASSYEPRNGSVDAWVFGATDVGGTRGGPCFTPADARAGRATSCSTGAQRAPTRAKTTAAPKPARARTATADGPGRTGSRAPATPTTAGATTSRPAATASKSATTAGTAVPSTTSAAAIGSSAPAIVDASQAASDRNTPGSGSATPLIVGIALAAVLAAGAAITMMRRRRTDPEL